MWYTTWKQQCWIHTNRPISLMNLAHFEYFVCFVLVCQLIVNWRKTYVMKKKCVNICSNRHWPISTNQQSINSFLSISVRSSKKKIFRLYTHQFAIYKSPIFKCFFSNFFSSCLVFLCFRRWTVIYAFSYTKYVKIIHRSVRFPWVKVTADVLWSFHAQTPNTHRNPIRIRTKISKNLRECSTRLLFINAVFSVFMFRNLCFRLFFNRNHSNWYNNNSTTSKSKYRSSAVSSANGNHYYQSSQRASTHNKMGIKDHDVVAGPIKREFNFLYQMLSTLTDRSFH